MPFLSPDFERASAAEKVRVGTRASPLALWQTEHVRSRLEAAGFPTERVEIRTTGDLVADVPLARIGSVALFTRQLDDAMLSGRIDLAVHSLKDLPTRLPDGIVLAAVGPRADFRDALVGRGALCWSQLPPSAIVATSSLRRRAQLLRARPDLQITSIRGNVDTRLRKLDETAEWTATVLAAAGLDRLGLGARIGERLPLDLMLPAPGQGALAITVRTDDHAAAAAARAALHDRETASAVSAERAFLRRLEGGCQAPIAAAASMGDGRLRLHGRVLSLDGAESVDVHGDCGAGDDPDALGTAVADEALRSGAGAILARVRDEAVT